MESTISVAFQMAWLTSNTETGCEDKEEGLHFDDGAVRQSSPTSAGRPAPALISRSLGEPHPRTTSRIVGVELQSEQAWRRCITSSCSTTPCLIVTMLENGWYGPSRPRPQQSLLLSSSAHCCQSSSTTTCIGRPPRKSCQLYFSWDLVEEAKRPC